MRLLAHIWMVQETETGREIGKAIKPQSPPANRSTSSSEASLPTGATSPQTAPPPGDKVFKATQACVKPFTSKHNLTQM